jgi:hypothetical protein
MHVRTQDHIVWWGRGRNTQSEVACMFIHALTHDTAKHPKGQSKSSHTHTRLHHVTTCQQDNRAHITHTTSREGCASSLDKDSLTLGHVSRRNTHEQLLIPLTVRQLIALYLAACTETAWLAACVCTWRKTRKMKNRAGTRQARRAFQTKLRILIQYL